MRPPSKYLPTPSQKADPQTTTETPFAAPSQDWLCRTWSVTHSTLAMWRTARNVRITYTALPDNAIDDLVEYEKKAALKNVAGVDRADATVPAAWNWRGKGWLRIASSHWEVLGWGERTRTGEGGGDGGVERWVVTWFAPTLFTKEGVDIYSDRPEGLSKETVDGILDALKAVDAPKMVEFVNKDMREVEVRIPWIGKNS